MASSGADGVTRMKDPQEGEHEVTVNQAAYPSNGLLTPAEVAAAFRVDPKTVTRWAKAGKLSSIRTLGGHRRYLEAEVRAALADVPGTDEHHLLIGRGSGVFR
jgi:excisionase family DNA binding protein